MADTLLQILPEAAAHPLLGGPDAFYAGTPSAGGTTTTLVCSDLTDNSGAKTYTGWNVYVYSSGNTPSLAGAARRVASVTLSSGTVTVNRAYDAATVTSDLFWLLRTFTRNDWRDFANQALREMKRRVVLTQVGLGANVKRYTPTAGHIARAEDLVDLRVRAYPEVTSTAQPRAMRWWAVEDNDATLSLVVSDDVGTAEELVYYVLKPFATSGQDTLTTDASTVPASVPRDWLIAEMVARATVVRWTQASEADRAIRLREMAAATALCDGFRKRYMPAPSRRTMAPEATW